MTPSPFRYGVRAYIDCAHHLTGHGACEAVHGHTYEVEISAAGPLARGGDLDLAGLSSSLELCLKRYDHQDLNEIFETPTCEVFCQSIFDELKLSLPYLKWVRVWEGHGKWAEVQA